MCFIFLVQNTRKTMGPKRSPVRTKSIIEGEQYDTLLIRHPTLKPVLREYDKVIDKVPEYLACLLTSDINGYTIENISTATWQNCILFLRDFPSLMRSTNIYKETN